MINKIFKSIILLTAIVCVLLLYGIYNQLSNNRYSFTDRSGVNVVFDTRNGIIYAEDEGIYTTYENGKEVIYKSIPK